MTPRQHADSLVRVLEGRGEEDAHLRVAARWLELIDRVNVGSAELKSLLADAQALPFMGSATIDLQQGVRGWAEPARRRAMVKEQKRELAQQWGVQSPR